MYTTQTQKKYPLGMDVATPNGPMYVEWKALCLQLGVSRAKALLRNWEAAQALHPSKREYGVFIHSNTYGCMDYWTISSVRYRGSLPILREGHVATTIREGKPMEATWSFMKKALLYKLF